MHTEGSLPFHHWLLADRGRTAAYQAALNQVVRKDDVVVDIGAGTGILSFFACRAGARKVYAIEMTDSVMLARELCASNGFGGRVEFRQGISQEIQLPEAADVLVSDTGASFGLQGGMLGTLLDAKKRFLKPGGRIIPHSMQLFVAPIEVKDERNLDIWKKDRYGLDLSAVRRYAANTDYAVRVGANDVLSSPGLLATILFQEVSSRYVSGETVVVAARDGVMHGLGAWIVLELAPGISFSNSPLGPTVDWTHSFFPIETPVALRAGDRVRAHLQTNNGSVWRWQVEVTSGATSAAGSASVKARFDHSTLGGFPVEPDRMKKLLPDYSPRLSRKGEAEKYLLEACDGRRKAAELADELLKRFPECFPSAASASQFVATVMGRCT